MKIYCLKIDLDEDKEFTETDMLMEYNSLRLKCVKNSERRHHIIYGDLLLQYVAYYERGIHPITIYRGRHGKPYIREGGCYNISHSGNWILCAYDEQDVGVDIQPYIDCNADLAKHYFAEEESAYLAGLTGKEQIIYFTDTWTFKESYIKTNGLSIFDVKNDNFAVYRPNYFIPGDGIIRNKRYHFVRGFLEDYSWCAMGVHCFNDYKLTRLSKVELIQGVRDLHYRSLK